MIFRSFDIAPTHSSLFDQPTVPQPDDAMTAGGVGFGMGDLDDGCSLAIQLLEQFHDLAALI